MWTRFVLLVSFALLTNTASAHGKHTHGEGLLDLLIEKNKITLALTLPLEVAVGFEHKPRNEKEKMAVLAIEKQLNAAATLWLFTPNAQCHSDSTQVDMPTFKDQHPDITATYVFRCQLPEGLKGIETTLFKHFKRLYRIEVQRAGPKNQGAARLSPKNPIVTW